MSEHEQQSEQGPEEQEETVKDLDVPEEEGKDVKGGAAQKFQEFQAEN